MGARTFPPAMDRGAGRGPALGVARSSRRAPAVQRARCAPPQDLVRVGVVGPIWPKRDRLQVRYVARAKCKNVLADDFLYLIVVCSISKKPLSSWKIPRAEFLSHFQDPIRAGRVQHVPFLAARLASRLHHEFFLHQRVIASNLTLIYGLRDPIRQAQHINRSDAGREAASTEQSQQGASGDMRQRRTRRHSEPPPCATRATHARSPRCIQYPPYPLARASVAVVVVRVVPRALCRNAGYCPLGVQRCDPHVRCTCASYMCMYMCMYMWCMSSARCATCDAPSLQIFWNVLICKEKVT